MDALSTVSTTGTDPAHRGAARIGILLEARYRRHAQPSGVARALRERGHHVRLVDPEEAAVDLADPGWCDGLDLLLCRGRSAAVLALLATAEARGITCVNGHDAVTLVVNKARAGAALAAGGVPVPRTFLGRPAELASMPEARPPLVLKPICGDNATGLRVLHSRALVCSTEWPEGVALAQHFVTTDGTDLKLYGVGDLLWAVRRPSPITAEDGTPRTEPSDPGTPVDITPQLTEIARRCREITGLELFGVDCAVPPDGPPLVLEVNDFPNYTGVDGIDACLADHVLARAGV